MRGRSEKLGELGGAGFGWGLAGQLVVACDPTGDCEMHDRMVVHASGCLSAGCDGAHHSVAVELAALDLWGSLGWRETGNEEGSASQKDAELLNEGEQGWVPNDCHGCRNEKDG